MENLLTKYRPRNLSEILGQSRVVEPLRLFAADPYSAAFLFFGESGVGKTATAQALAHDLGVAVEEAELGGLFEIASGEQTAQNVRGLADQLRYRPLSGSGWRVVIVNECDKMRSEAETLWLDILERLPARTVIVFTTNMPEKLSRRFRDRCEVYHFTHDRDELQPHIQALARRVWKEAGKAGEPPSLDTLGMPTLSDDDAMHASFRLALQQLAKLIRYVRTTSCAAESLVQDGWTASEALADCPWCGKAIKVKTGARSVRCPKCGKKCELELV